MPRILVSVICAHWIVGFALRAAGIAGFAGTEPPEAWSLATLASVGCMVAAALFLWLAATALCGLADATDIAALAVATGIVALALSSSASGAAAGQLYPDLGVHIASLCCTYLVVRSAGGSSGVAPAADGETQARRMAIGAAHGTMLARLSGRRPGMAGSEA